MDLPRIYRMRKSWTFLAKYLFAAGGLLLVGWSLIGTEASPKHFLAGIPTILGYIAKMYPPDTSILERIWNPLGETFQIAIVAIVVSIIVATPLSFLGARNTTPNKFIYQAVKTVLGTLRGIPPLLYAIFLVAMVGLGPFAGTMALSLHVIGALGRYFSEAVENINPDVINAAKAAGSNKIKTIIHTIIPELKVLFLGYILYYFESNIRNSTTLGLVGAGGIGLLLITSIHLFKYHEVGTIMLVIVSIIIIMDRLSFVLRSKLIRG